jgi:hypothetical protein
MTQERMIGMIESVGKYPCLRTETGRVWSLSPAPGTSKDRQALLDFRIGEQAEVTGGVSASLAGENHIFTVFSQRLPDGSQINLMQDHPAKVSFV